MRPVAGALVIATVTLCAAAAAPASAATVSPTHVRFPQLAVDGHGRMVVAWQRLTKGRFILEARLGGSPLTLRRAQVLTRNSEGPRAAIGDDGSAAVMWTEIGDHGSRSLRVSVALPGHRFGRAQLLDQRRANIGTVGVAVQPNGRIVAVWRRKGTLLGYALASRGKPFRAAHDLTAFSQLNAPSVALDPRDGAVVVAYATPPSLSPPTNAQAGVRTIKPAQPEFSAPTVLTGVAGSASGPLDEAHPVAVTGPAGTGVAYSITGASGGLYLVRRAADGSWPTRERIGVIGAIPDVFAQNLQATLPTGGSAVAAWSVVTEAPGGLGGVVSSRLVASIAQPGTPFGPPQALTPAGATFSPPALVSARGNTFVATARKDGRVLVATRIAGAAAFGHPAPLTDKGDGDVVLAASGSHVVAGYQQGDRLRLRVLR
jgi:hypothetical protein